MTGLRDAYTAKVYRQDIEGSIRRALEDASQSTYKGIGTIVGHGIYHQSSGSATAQWLHESRRQAAHPFAVDAAKIHQVFDAANEVIHGSRSTEHTDAYQNGNQIGDDADGCRETFLGSFHKGIVYIDLLPDAGDDESDDEDFILVEDMSLDLDELVVSDVVLTLPSKILCSDDCKGLCPQCGKDLNQGSCECTESKGDPRFDVLNQLLT